MNTDSKKTLQIVALSLFFLLIIVYGFWGSHDIIFGIKIKEVNISDGATIANSIVDITGNAQNAIHITLNGREIPINEKGDFSETFALLRGYNIINITAKDKFGYSDEKNYKLMY